MYRSVFAHLNYCIGVSISVTTHIVDAAEFYNKQFKYNMTFEHCTFYVFEWQIDGLLSTYI